MSKMAARDWSTPASGFTWSKESKLDTYPLSEDGVWRLIFPFGDQSKTPFRICAKCAHWEKRTIPSCKCEACGCKNRAYVV